MGLLDRYRKQAPPTPDRPPRSAAGRGHTQGFLELEELNEELQGYAGLQIYDRMYRTDGDIRQVVAMSCNPIIGGTWKVIPHGGQEAKPEDVEIANFVQWALFEGMDPGWVAHITEMLPALARWGHVLYEETWKACEYDGKTYLIPNKLDLRLPRTIVRWFQDRYGNLTSVVQHLPVPLNDLVGRGYPASASNGRKASNGRDWLQPGEVEIMANNLTYYRLGGEGDNWEGVSLLRPAYKHWYLKDAIERIDAIAQEREAVGIPICYPPLSATGRQLDQMEAVLQSMRTNDQGYIVAPGPKAGTGAPDGQGWLIEVIGYERTGSGRDPQPSLNYHTQKIAAAFIAEFMRLGHGQSGARATAQVQADPFLQSVEALSHVVEDAVQPLVDKVTAYNFPNAKHPPKLQMSLVDSTSLSQLADYVLKLTQVGALFPDQELEDFLRARADLPPSNPDSVKKRAKDDDELRMEVVKGAGPNGDANGQNGGGAKPAAGKTGKSKPSGSKKARQHSMTEYDDTGRRVRYRSRRPQEEHVDLDGIEDYLDDLPQQWAIELQADIVGLAQGKTCDLKNKMHKLMSDAYAAGAADLRKELMQAHSYQLSVRDMGIEGLEARSAHAERYILSSMELGAAATRLNRGDDESKVQLAAETEGLRSLRNVAMGHGQGAYLQGRHDAITLAGDQFPEVLVLYVALLDRNTCEECAAADDGIPRRLDDPIRLQRRPPNQDCFSTASGHNYCRCLEVPVVGI